MGKKNIFIITGKQGSGKTTFLYNLVLFLKEKNIYVGGIAAKGIWEKSNRVGFDIINLMNGQSKNLCSKYYQNNWLKTGSFFFNPEGILFGEKILTFENSKFPEIIVIDEIGPFELRGQVWAKKINELLVLPDLLMIWVVRKSLLEKVKQNWDFQPVSVWEVGDSEPYKAGEFILNYIQAKKKVQGGC